MNRIAVPWRVADLAQEVQHLGLDRDVERGGRLVGDQQLRLERETHGDHRPLLHAARELVRILAGALLRLAQMDVREQLHRARPRRRPCAPTVDHVGLADLPVDAQHRIERAQRVLGDHRDPVAPDRAQLGLGQPDQGVAGEPQVATGDPDAARQQPLHRERGHRLAAAQLADQADDLARPDLQADGIGQPGGAAPAVVDDRERIDLERRRAALAGLAPDRGPVSLEGAGRRGHAGRRPEG